MNADDTSFTLRAVFDDASVGTLTAHRMLSPNGERLWIVFAINVEPHLRRRGIASALYAAAAKEATARGGSLASDTRSSAEARGFWRKQMARGYVDRPTAVSDVENGLLVLRPEAVLQGNPRVRVQPVLNG